MLCSFPSFCRVFTKKVLLLFRVSVHVYYMCTRVPVLVRTYVLEYRYTCTYSSTLYTRTYMY